ncbi:MAG: hypothetical protein HON70_09365 [Lentisphaerae bacterium]|jgi:hypothetical protein|nr:hypothetical protein [Lentisphaerota bacterium]
MYDQIARCLTSGALGATDVPTRNVEVDVSQDQTLSCRSRLADLYIFRTNRWGWESTQRQTLNVEPG